MAALSRLAEAWNSRDPKTIADSYTPDGVRHEIALPGARLVGREAIAAHVAGYIHAVPDCVLDIRGTTEQGDVAVLEWTYRGTHTGELPNLPARGADLVLQGVSVCRMAGDLVAEERVYWDGATLLTSAGVLPEG